MEFRELGDEVLVQDSGVPEVCKGASVNNFFRECDEKEEKGGTHTATVTGGKESRQLLDARVH